jgi:hypothetical protein
MTRLWAVLALVVLGCGSDTEVKVAISPKTAMVVVGQTAHFNGTQTVSTPTSIDVNDDVKLFDWSVVEPNGGTIAPDSVGYSYIYTAPVGPGTFHVQIKSKMDGSATDRATITVVAP